MISVIIPCYNAAKYIEQAIESVLKQDIEKEIIIIDDCSIDHTANILQNYLVQENVTIHTNVQNLGVAASRNLGVKLARGEYIAFLDADDYWAEDKLKKQIKELQKGNGVFSYTARRLITEDGEVMNKVIPVHTICTYEMLVRHNEITCSSVLMKKEIATEFLMKHDNVHEDYLTWLRVLKKYGAACGINEPLLNYRLSENGKSRNKIKSAKMTYGVHRYMGDGKWKSFRYTLFHLLEGLKKYR
ncbi:MAG: glycosyltransferase family 2 protein [Velocimicrobium sp.]